MSDNENRLVMARFAMHKNAVAKYGIKVLSHQITQEQAAEEYRKTMENYDQILELAVTEPERLNACQEDMKRGFYIDVA